jgi:hypothetical protein
MLLGCVCSLDNNEIGGPGAVGLGEGLKTNTALEYLKYVDALKLPRSCPN